MSTTDTNPAPATSITVRFVENTTTRRYWFEEKLTNGQWSKLHETDMACEGNARHCLAELIEKRRQQRLMIFMKIGKEETFQIT